MQNKKQYDIYNVSSLQNGYIQVKNNGGFVAKFEVSYTLKRSVEHFLTDNIAIGGIRNMEIPEGATSIYVKVSVFNSGGTAIPVYNNILNGDSSIVDLELYGTMWNPSFHIIKETEPTAALIKFINYGMFVTNALIAYYVNGVRYSLDLGYFYLGMTRSINLPNKAKTIRVYAQVNINGLSNWHTVYSKIFENATSVTITMTGTIWYPYASEKIEPINSPKGSNNPVVSTPMPNTLVAPNNCATLNILEQYKLFMKSKHDEFMKSI